MSRELTKMFEWAAYKYNVHDYNEQADEIKKRSKLAYNLMVSYEPETWANAFLPGVRYVILIYILSALYSLWPL